MSPCSGTHVRNSGEVGPIFISGVEKLSQTLKVSFLCGKRVLKQFHRDSDVLKLLSKTLTTSTELLPDSLTKLQDQVKDLRKELARLKEEQWKREALEIYASAEQWNDLKRIIQVWLRPYSEVRYIAQKLLEQPSAVGALLSVPDKRVVFFKHPK